MKKFVLAILLSVGVQMSGVAGPAHDHGKEHKAVHGGLFSQAAYDYELLVKDREARLFVTDHGQPVILSGSTAKVTILEGTRKTDIDMTPSGQYFVAKTALNPGKGAKAVVQLKIGGKASTARFTF